MRMERVRVGRVAAARVDGAKGKGGAAGWLAVAIHENGATAGGRDPAATARDSAVEQRSKTMQ